MVSLKSTLWLLSSLALASTTTAPLPDGIYEFSVDDAGIETFDKIGELQPMPETINARDTMATEPHLYRRNAYKCYTVTLSKNDIGTATYNLGRTCDSNGVTVQAKKNMVSVVGDVAVYVCNPNRRVITCSSSYLDRAIGFIEDNCPVNRAGYHLFNDKGLTQQKYGYTRNGEPLCPS